ncbi:MAG TPA: SRPBCC domain-containing protein [Flavitalea sp.]|nr:SRPBCC domain-containing protein [Flavitalea sp.]
MSAYDWSKFKCRITIDAPPEKIYIAWSTRHGLESWFLRRSELSTTTGELRGMKETVRPSDTYEWYWHGYPDTTVERGSFLDANGYDLIRFTFAKVCIVTVTIFREEGEMICELVQSQIPEDESSKVQYHLGCSLGWTFYLANLKSILEGGIDLRNKNESVREVVNA